MFVECTCNDIIQNASTFRNFSSVSYSRRPNEEEQFSCSQPEARNGTLVESELRNEKKKECEGK